jgi:Tfp pilus assembly protein FimT
LSDLAANNVAKSGRSAFTLVELCVSLALITLIATIAIPIFFGRAKITLDNAAELLASDIRSGQNQAAFLERPVRLHFISDGEGYWIDDAISAISDSVPLIANRRYSVNAVFEDVRVKSVTYAEGDQLSFGPRGIASTSTRITLSLGEETRVVTVAAPSGGLTIEGTTRDWTDNGY